LGLLYAEVASFRDAKGAAFGTLHLRAREGAGAAATAESLFQEDYHVEGWSSEVLTMLSPCDYVCNVEETHAIRNTRMCSCTTFFGHYIMYVNNE
jgi:hypothetical protein